ncbi:MAG: hypothetical protein JSR41_10750 [Proteobacteria bacterium]|nr:hypothetical protein [Pseudomonadota bacterium]
MNACLFDLAAWPRIVYGALCAQGVGACLIAAAAGWLITCRGLRLTGHEPSWLTSCLHPVGPGLRRTDDASRERAGMRRWLGSALQLMGALWMATALVALARVVGRG